MTISTNPGEFVLVVSNMQSLMLKLWRACESIPPCQRMQTPHAGWKKF